MKLSKRGIVALALAVLMVLTSVPAFAATVTVPAVIDIPDEGLPITWGGCGWSMALKIVLSDESAAVLGVSGATGADYLKDTTFSGVMTYKNVDTAVNDNGKPFLGTITFNDAVVTSSVANDAKTKYCLVISMAAMRANSPELTEAYENDPANFQTVNFFNSKDCGNYSLSNAVLKKGTNILAQTATVDSGAFPESAVFVAASGFGGSTTGWAATGADGYSFYQRRDNVDGPYAVFKAKKSGDYKVWGLVKNWGDTNGSRFVVISVNGTQKMAFNRTNAKAPGSNFNVADYWYWEPAGNNPTVTLTEGQDTVIRLDKTSGTSARYAGFALVPVEENFTMDAATAQSAEMRLTPTVLTQLQSVTTDRASVETGADVKVTVNGTEVTAKAHAALSAGAVVPLNDLTGTFITKPTVLDALQAAKIDTKTYANGVLANGKVTLNGKTVNNFGYLYVKAGDEITATVSDTMDKTNFAPFAIGAIRNTEGGAISPNEGCVKFCVNTGTLPEFAKTKEDTGFKDCYFNGIITTSAAHGIIPVGEKIYFKNVKVRDIQAYSSTRLDLVLDRGYISSSKTQSSAEWWAECEAKAMITMPDGTVKHDPTMYIMQAGIYNFNELYITNSQTETGVKVIDNGNHYVLLADGLEHVLVTTVTKNSDGNVVSTDTVDTFVSFNSPLAVTPAANQTVYVWNMDEMTGTTMQPVCRPLTK